MFHSLLISINADRQTAHTLMCNDLNEIESKPVPSTVIATIQSVRYSIPLKEFIVNEIYLKPLPL